MDDDEIEFALQAEREAEEEKWGYMQFAGQREDNEFSETSPQKSPDSPPSSPSPSPRHDRQNNEPSSPAAPPPPHAETFSDYFFKFPVLGQKEVTITTSSGERRFVTLKKPPHARKRRSNFMSSPDDDDDNNIIHKPSLLSTSIAELRARLESREQANRELARNRQPPPPPPATKPHRHHRQHLNHNIQPLTVKHAPIHFWDLLSHERKNKEVLKWVKAWDEHVFSHKDVKPEKRLLLLCGPPGTGKTTLANVVARHCGYQVVEVNASDDRSAEQLEKHIISSTENKSMFQNKKPNLVVLDEIDGTRDGADAILKIKDKLRRPVILICNDEFALSLREVKKHCLVVRVMTPGRTRLVKRLRQICLTEDIDARPGAVELLCHRMGDDIRAALNALDFFRSSSLFAMIKDTDGRIVLDVQTVQALPASSKDSEGSFFQTWHDLFQPNATPAIGGGGGGTLVTRMNDGFDLDDVLSRNIAANPELLLYGMHENFPLGKYRDATMKRTADMCEWMVNVDVIHSRMVDGGEWDHVLGSQLSTGFFGMRKTLSKVAWTGKQVWPKNIQEFVRKKAKYESIVDEVRDHARKMGSGAMTSHTTLVEDVAPMLTRIMLPAANSGTTKTQMRHSAELMHAYGIEFTSGWFANHTEPVFEPGFELLSRFDGIPESVVMVQDNVRAGIFAEYRNFAGRLAMEKRMSAIHATTTTTTTQVSENNHPPPITPTSSPSLPTTIRANNNNKKLEIEPSRRRDLSMTVKKDFFGRPIVRSQVDMVTEDGTASAKKKSRPDVLFKFSEGVGDAVKRVVKLRELY